MSIAIIISAVIISRTVFIALTKDPLNNYMIKIIAEGNNAMVAAHLCLGKTNK